MTSSLDGQTFTFTKSKGNAAFDPNDLSPQGGDYRIGVWTPGQAGGAPSMEDIIRPFVLVESAPRERPRKKPLLPGETGDAFIKWGGPSQFLQNDRNRPPVDPVDLSDPSGGHVLDGSLNPFNERWPPEEPDEPGEDEGQDEDRNTRDEQNGCIARWRQIQRCWRDVRVENPNDSQQYVIVRRITSTMFEDGAGRRIVFEFKDD